jgi:adenylate cyclase
VFTGHQGDFDRYKEAYAEGAFDVISKAQQGVVLAKEVTVKLKAALDRRELFLRASTYARHIDHKLQEKYGLVLEEKTLTRRWVTIMFTDIRGFSAVTDKLKAHQAVITDLLAELYGVLVDCAHRHGGIVDKFIGDGSMVLFGVLEATTANDQSTDLSAVQAALDMQTACEPLIDILQAKASELEAVQMPELALGIGINRAEVFVGIIGTKHRDQFTAIGHGVNLAARYESAACKRYEKGKGNYGKILLSSTVQHHVAKHFNLKKEPSLTNIRNIGDPHPVWSVESKKNRPG